MPDKENSVGRVFRSIDEVAYLGRSAEGLLVRLSAHLTDDERAHIALIVGQAKDWFALADEAKTAAFLNESDAYLAGITKKYRTRLKPRF